MKNKQLLKVLLILGFLQGSFMANAKKSVPWGDWCFEPAIGSFAEGPYAVSFWDELTAKKIVFIKSSASGRNSMPMVCYREAKKASSVGFRLCTKWAGSSETSIPAGLQITLDNVKDCYVVK